ncbi:uncharacterized protein BDZ83DRAFT_607649 [Colletotrichum acutatum]|uniref:Uncharacterized protein n=1 Tax=Glomerella acutata TaxID=27357 RepID=A0AAD8XKC6_GLOAC|nr:uncharacterized protein BDZ83DRAFT_607649 [Colletotrichum acutatum]KAK1728972.1 hypothetical protein BDZ83DRAFT_607649 [Colletotrichum acutatum]
MILFLREKHDPYHAFMWLLLEGVAAAVTRKLLVPPRACLRTSTKKMSDGKHKSPVYLGVLPLGWRRRSIGRSLPPDSGIDQTAETSVRTGHGSSAIALVGSVVDRSDLS